MRAIRGVEQRLGPGNDMPSAVQHDLADLFAERRAARLARDDDFVAEVGEALREPLDLRRFADGFPAFERDEFEEGRSHGRKRPVF